MTSLDWPTPEALALTVPHFSPQALDHLIAQITPHPAAILGLVAARLCSASTMMGAAIGAVIAWALGLVIDTVRWRASDICFSCPDLPRATLDRAVAELHDIGVNAALEVDMHGSNPDATIFQIRSRMRLRSIVERRLAELNIS